MPAAEMLATLDHPAFNLRNMQQNTLTDADLSAMVLGSGTGKVLAARRTSGVVHQRTIATEGGATTTVIIASSHRIRSFQAFTQD